jgi:hypothetical protein
MHKDKGEGEEGEEERGLEAVLVGVPEEDEDDDGLVPESDYYEEVVVHQHHLSMVQNLSSTKFLSSVRR